MKLKIKNDIIQRVISFEKTNSLLERSFFERSEIFAKMSAEDMAYQMLWGYIYTILEISEDPMVKIPLDLTYSTVENLPRLVGGAFLASRNQGDSDAESIEIAEKTVASYLYFLATNEHGTKIQVEKSSNGKWASALEISAQALFIKADFLSDMKGQVILVKDNLLEIRMDKVISSYKVVTGVDLKDYCVDSAQCEFPPRIKNRKRKQFKTFS